MTLSTEVEVVAAEMDGLLLDDPLRDSEPPKSMLLRLDEESRLFRLGISSTLFLFGDPRLVSRASRECSRRFSRNKIWTCSIVEEFGSDAEMLSEVELRELELRVGVCCLGLPQLRVLCGGRDGEVLLGGVSPRPDRVKMELVLRRDNEGGVEGA